MDKCEHATECDLGPVIGEWRTVQVPVVPQRADWVEKFKGVFMALLAWLYALFLFVLLVFGFWLYSAFSASAQVLVPAECAAIAARHGFPTDVMTRRQALRAKLRLATLSGKDPDVSGCRAAIQVHRDKLKK